MELNTGKEVLREPLVSPGQQWALWACQPPTPGPSLFEEQCPHRDQEEAAGPASSSGWLPEGHSQDGVLGEQPILTVC